MNNSIVNLNVPLINQINPLMSSNNISMNKMMYPNFPLMGMNNPLSMDCMMNFQNEVSKHDPDEIRNSILRYKQRNEIIYFL